MLTNESQGNVRYSVLILSERLRAILEPKSNATRAIESLRKIVRNAEKAGMPGFALEAHLAIGEIEIDALAGWFRVEQSSTWSKKKRRDEDFH